MAENSDVKAPLRRVGALWKPRPGSKSLGSGSITIGDQRQRFLIVENDRKAPGSRRPDFWLVSSDEPEVDGWARDHDVRAKEAQEKTPF